ncbi:acyl-CoA dehydrogenase family protein [Rhizohabitans arisaemae]|uniref:acyl-CoA dehydrogenase family protein n=1 Tax=Rhizohabitans arisaemae TaxID=2720610 RepID=UPI0024B27FA9|nr:acyl-CoA dehydrogenase family protein [Rhizohabitans arisaemae]
MNLDQSTGMGLTGDQRALQRLAREFAMKEVLPLANELDPIDGEIPLALREKMADIGFFGIMVPEEYGGLGLGVLEYCITAEELSRAWMSVGSLIARGNGLHGGFSPRQKAEKLPLVARGEFLSAIAISEAEAGSDVANITCRATRTGDGWILSGTKMWCTFADGADYLVVFARTAPPPGAARRHEGVSAFYVPKERGGLPPGVSGTRIRKIGYRGWKTWELAFEDLRLPEDALLGEEGKAFRTIMEVLDVARVHTAARSIGLARGALEDSLAYAVTRRQFDSRIADFQAIRFKLAGMAAEIESARQLMYAVCREIDAGRKASTQASMVKLLASEMAERVTSEGIQIHGGAGYTTDCAVERHWRDARLTKIFEGTSEIQLRVISDALLGR